MSSIRVMGEPVDIITPVPNCEDNWADVASCSQLYGTLNDLSSSLSVDVSGLNSADNFITDSAAIVHDKPVNNIKKKKKKKKGKKNSKYPDNAIPWTGPIECGQKIRTSFQSCNLEDKTASCHKHSQLIPPSDNISVCVHETYEGCLKDATNNDRKLIPECLFCGPFEHTENFVNSAYKNIEGNTVICCRGIKEIRTRVEEPKAIEKKITMHCNNGCIKGLKENLSHGDLSLYLSHGTDSIMCSTSEGSNGGRTNKTQLSSRSTTSRNTYAVYPSGQNNVFFQNNILDRTRCQHHIQTGKENTDWQKSKKHNRDTHKHWIKTQNHIYIPKDVKSVEKNLFLKYDSLSNNGLLPTPIVPSAHHAFSHQVMKNKQGIYIKAHCNVLVESSQWINHHRCHSDRSQVDSELRQEDTAGDSKGEGKLKEKRKFLFKHEYLSNSKKHYGDVKANFYRFRNRTCLPQADSFEIPGQLHQYNNQDFSQSVNHNRSIPLDEPHCSHSYPSVHTQLNFPHTTVSDVMDCTLFPGIQPYTSMKIPRNEDVSVESLQASLDKLQRNPFCLGIKSSYEDNYRQDLSSRVSLQKWVPVGRKDSEVLKKVESVYSGGSLKYVRDTCNGNADLHLEKLVPVSISVDPEKTCLISSHGKPKMTTTEKESPQLNPICKNIEHNDGEERARGYAPRCDIKNDTPLLYIGSQAAIETLNASYRLQIVSENIQLGTGSHLAEFEKFLQLASPVIALSSALQHCDVCWGNRLPLTSICKHQLANIRLRDVWSWYEKPGNYGLEVRVEDSKNLKRVNVNSISFNAHFVPFLSAIQLFGYSQKPQSRNSIGDLNSENTKSGDSKFNYFLTGESVDGPESSPSTASGDVHDFSFLSSPPCSNDMELIFEFFENEQPQQRKPLYDKVMDILKVGTSGHQVFGDPSKLDCTNFHNLHPASWYSVAWYPIYRIPEGNLRASFLTYHSLGHLVHRCKSESQKDNLNCVVSPALGMQSYNAQGECWFSPKSHVDSSIKELSPRNSSEILKERLRTLEETARILARGCVYKDHVKVTNRQPDFEFFLSRKR